MDDLCIFHIGDADVWLKYIKENCIKVDPSCKIHTACVRDNRKGVHTDNSSPLFVVVVTGDLISWLSSNDDEATTKTFTSSPGKGILLFCGPEIKDLQLTPTGHTKPLSDKFVDYEKWKKFAHTKSPDMIAYITKLLQHAKTVTMMPLEVTCEGETLVVLSFAQPLSADVKVQVLMKDTTTESSLPLTITTQYLNPYSHSFIAPVHRAGLVSVEVMVGGKKMRLETTTLSYTSQLCNISSLSEIYIHQLKRLCELYIESGRSVGTIDKQLIQFFDAEDSIPSQAFELLFGVYRHSSDKWASSELPTLLHFGARYGCEELCSKLVDLPDAKYACAIKNKDGRTPEDLARHSGHHQLAEFLENCIQMNEEIEAVYVELFGYVEHDPDPKFLGQSGGGYLKAKPRYMNMNGRGASNGQCQDMYSDMYQYTQRSNITTGMANKKVAGNEAILPPPRAVPPTSPGIEGAHRKPAVPPPTVTVPQTSCTSTAVVFPGATNGHETATATSLKSKSSAVLPPKDQATDRKTYSHKKLIEIQEMYKKKEISIDEAHILYQSWRMMYQRQASKSYKDHQVESRLKAILEKLARVREEVSAIKKK